MYRSTFLIAGLVLLIAVLGVAFWPSGGIEDGLGVYAGPAAEEEQRSEASVSLQPSEEEAQREELDPSLIGIGDALVVTVVDEYKRPVSDVTVAITSTGELPIWVVDLGRRTDAQGRAVFDRAQALRTCEESGWEEVIIGVWDWKLRGFRVEETVVLADHSSLRFELPGVQQILVKLHGFPSSVAPVLSPAEGSTYDAMEISGLHQADGWWRFDEPPLGEVWDLLYARVTVEEGTGIVTPHKRIDIPGKIQFVGPGVPGEITRAESNLMDQPVVQGRLVDEEGRPLRLGRNARDLSLRGISDAGSFALQRFHVEYLSSGLFLAWPTGRREQDQFAVLGQSLVNLGYLDASQLPAEEQTLGLHQLQKLYFSWVPDNARNEISSEILRVGRDAMVLLPLGQPGVTLGDVTMPADNYLTRFRVVNEAGEPVADADIGLVLVAEGERRDLRSTFLSDLETGRSGEAWLMAPSWQLIERTARGGSAERRPTITGLRVSVDARAFIRHSEVVPLGTREVTITLKSGGGLSGAVVFSEGFSSRFRVRALAPGSPVLAEEELGSDSVRPRRGRDTFRIRQLPEGTVDLVIAWGWSQDWPVWVERGIPIRAGEETALTSFEASPFDQRLRWVEVEVPEGVAEGSRAVVTHRARAGVEYRTLVPADDGLWKFPIPAGSAAWTGGFTAQGYEPLEVRSIGAGRHKFDLKALRRLVIKPSSGVEGYGDTWFLGISSGESQMAEFDPVSRDIALRLQGPGEYELSWYRPNGARFDRNAKTTTIVVTEADLARGELVVHPPPNW